jgi:hypothetical protein
MNYQEMLDYLADQVEVQRNAIITEHWQTVLSDGFVAFVQGQIESARSMTVPGGLFEQIFEGQTDEIKEVMREQMVKSLARHTSVWDSMASVYQRLQKYSEQQGSTGGMVDHGSHDRMPRGVQVGPAAHCYRCGSSAVNGGLCSGCQATEQDWREDDLEYGRQLQRQQRDDLDNQRLQDDYIYQANQPDFNSYGDY